MIDFVDPLERIGINREAEELVARELLQLVPGRPAVNVVFQGQQAGSFCNRKDTGFFQVDLAPVRPGSFNLDAAEHAQGRGEPDNVLGHVRKEQFVPLDRGLYEFVQLLFQ